MIAHLDFQFSVGYPICSEGFYIVRNRPCYTYGIHDLNFTFVGKLCFHNMLGAIPHHVGSGAVSFRGSLPEKAASPFRMERPYSGSVCRPSTVPKAQVPAFARCLTRSAGFGLFFYLYFTGPEIIVIILKFFRQEYCLLCLFLPLLVDALRLCVAGLLNKSLYLR